MLNPNPDFKSQLGMKAGPYTEKVTREWLQGFCGAVGAPVSTVAPPTFVTVARKGEFEICKNLGVDLAHILHGEQEYRSFQDLNEGDTFTYTTTFQNVVEKQGSSGFLRIITLETLVEAGAKKIAESKTVFVHRPPAQKGDSK
jgi:hypothetical protein